MEKYWILLLIVYIILIIYRIYILISGKTRYENFKVGAYNTFLSDEYLDSLKRSRNYNDLVEINANLNQYYNPESVKKYNIDIYDMQKSHIDKIPQEYTRISELPNRDIFYKEINTNLKRLFPNRDLVVIDKPNNIYYKDITENSEKKRVLLFNVNAKSKEKEFYNELIVVFVLRNLDLYIDYSTGENIGGFINIIPISPSHLNLIAMFSSNNTFEFSYIPRSNIELSDNLKTDENLYIFRPFTKNF
jgi:hypothetical protein